MSAYSSSKSRALPDIQLSTSPQGVGGGREGGRERGREGGVIAPWMKPERATDNFCGSQVINYMVTLHHERILGILKLPSEFGFDTKKNLRRFDTKLPEAYAVYVLNPTSHVTFQIGQ